jgi:MraZ protein
VGKVFFGSYVYTIDNKGRLVIPSKMRSMSGSTLFAMRGFEQCLSLFTKETFEQFTNQLNTLNFQQPNVRQYIRLALSSVIELDIDDHGRIQIPNETLKKYNLEKTVKIVGVHDHIEIWDKATWDKFEDTDSADFEKLAEKLSV